MSLRPRASRNETSSKNSNRLAHVLACGLEHNASCKTDAGTLKALPDLLSPCTISAQKRSRDDLNPPWQQSPLRAAQRVADWIREHRSDLQADSINFVRRQIQVQWYRAMGAARAAQRILTQGFDDVTHLFDEVLRLNVEEAKAYIDEQDNDDHMLVLASLLPRNVIKNFDVALKMIERDPTVMMVLPRALQSNSVLRVVAYGSSKSLDMPTVDAIMIFRDTPLEDLIKENNEWNAMYSVAFLPEGYAPLSTPELAAEHNEAQKVANILDVLSDEEAVKGAVEKRGEILPFLGVRYTKNLEYRLLACKTYPRAALWVLQDLAKPEAGVVAYGEAGWKKRIKQFLSDIYYAAYDARILDKGPKKEDVESASDSETMDYYSQLIGDIIAIYTPHQGGERVRIYTNDEYYFRLRIVALAKQAQDWIMRPGGLVASMYPKDLQMGGGDDIAHTPNPSGLIGRVSIGKEVEARRDRLRCAFGL